MVIAEPRGMRVNRDAIRHAVRDASPPMVRLLFYVRDQPELTSEWHWLLPLAMRLQSRDIQIHVELCTDVRLCSIARQKHRPNELFCLGGLAPRHQRLFQMSDKPAILLGSPAPGLSLPFIMADQTSAIKHATLKLLRQGFTQLNLVIPQVTAFGIQESVSDFRSAGAEWPHQPVSCQAVPMPVRAVHLLNAARRYAARISGRRGIVVVAPVPVGLILTALLERRIEVPGQVEIAAILPSPAAIQLCPPIHHYPLPARRMAKELADAAVHYFEAGSVPPMHKRLPLELVRESA